MVRDARIYNVTTPVRSRTTITLNYLIINFNKILKFKWCSRFVQLNIDIFKYLKKVLSKLPFDF